MRKIAFSVAFGDNAIAEDILSTTDVAEIKALGRRVSHYDDDRFDIKRWKGQNLLGFALMGVREILRGEVDNDYERGEGQDAV